MFGVPRPREAANAAVWQARQRRCVEAIQAARPDVAMLQEIYLMDECVQLYTQAFESEYNLFFHRRPGKEDGLLTMVRREVLRAVGPAQNLTLTPRGDRVTTVLAVAPAGDDDASPTLLVANTHLSFDHGKLWDKRLRRLQAEALTAALHARDTELAVPTVAYLLAGDLNGDRQEQVYGHLKKEGYWDSSAAVGEAGGSGITHLTHNGRRMEADYVLLRAKEALSGATEFVSSGVLPEGLPASDWPESAWGSVSDHRPLVATLDWRLARASSSGQ